LVDENGTLVNREEYYPFGETSFGSYSKKRYRFCGKEKDAESGLYYYGARYYAPWLCRFTSVDPLAGKYVYQSPFAYADNNPINKMDYNGEGTGEGGDSETITPVVNNSSKDSNNHKLNDDKQGTLTININEPSEPDLERDQIEVLKNEGKVEEAKKLEEQWAVFDKQTRDLPKLQQIKKRIDEATPESDPVLYEMKQEILKTGGDKTITLYSSNGPLRDPITGDRAYGQAQTNSLYPDSAHIAFDLDYIETASNDYTYASPTISELRRQNEWLTPRNSPVYKFKLDIGGVIAHEFGHALDHFQGNNRNMSNDNKVKEENPNKWEKRYYINKHPNLLYKQ
jgi:RHS repeat-associated protein